MQLLANAKTVLKNSSIDSASLDARLLLQHALAISHEDIVREPDKIMAQQAADHFMQLVERRASGEPVSRIIGAREFWGLEFFLSPATLDPRPDSETLIETALKYFTDTSAALDILDLGTGSGCLLIALLHEYKHANGAGIDQSEEALGIAAQNATHNHVQARAEWIKGDWFEGWDSNRLFDMIISNPPYIPVRDKNSLAREVIDHDPHTALFGGPDGLDCYRVIFKDLKNHLKHDGLAFFEIGQGQDQSIRHLAEAAGLSVRAIVPDLAGIPRCAVIKS